MMAISTNNKMDDIVQEILLRLPVKSLARCKSLSKQWHNFISVNKSFCRNYLSRNRGCPLMLGLFFTKHRAYHDFPTEPVRFLRTSTQGRSTTLKKRKRGDGDDYDETFTTPAAVPLPLDESLSFLGHPTVHLQGSSNGFLLSSLEQETPMTYFICNPVNKQYLSLPTPNITSCRVSHGFVFLATYPCLDSVHYYKVVRGICNPKVFSTTLTIEILSSDSPHQWKLLNLTCPFSFYLDCAYLSTIISEQGLIYLSAIVHDETTDNLSDCLVILDQSKKECLQLVEFPQQETNGELTEYFGQSNGLILYAQHELDQFKIWVLHDKDDCTREWSRKHRGSLELTVENFPEIIEDWYSGGFSIDAFHPKNPHLLFLSIGKKKVIYDADNSTLELISNFSAQDFRIGVSVVAEFLLARIFFFFPVGESLGAR